MKSMDTGQLSQLMNKCWMTYDGMWFFHCLEKLGIQQTNRLNKAAIRSLAPIEMKRLQKAFGLDRMDGFEQIKTSSMLRRRSSSRTPWATRLHSLPMTTCAWTRRSVSRMRVSASLVQSIGMNAVFFTGLKAGLMPWESPMRDSQGRELHNAFRR